MIKKRVGRNLGAIIEIMRVDDVYTDSDSNPVVDLVNSKAQRFQGCDIVKFWGENVNLISSLEKGNEVLTITGTPVIFLNS